MTKAISAFNFLKTTAPSFASTDGEEISEIEAIAVEQMNRLLTEDNALTAESRIPKQQVWAVIQNEITRRQSSTSTDEQTSKTLKDIITWLEELKGTQWLFEMDEAMAIDTYKGEDKTSYTLKTACLHIAKFTIMQKRERNRVYRQTQRDKSKKGWSMITPEDV